MNGLIEKTFVANIIHELNDKQLVDLQKLYKQGWWSSNRTINDCKKIVDNSSIIFGMVDHKNNLIAFSRVLTDYFLFSYIYDVLVDSKYQGLGLGRRVVEEIINYPALQGINNIELVCPKEMMDFQIAMEHPYL